MPMQATRKGTGRAPAAITPPADESVAMRCNARRG